MKGVTTMSKVEVEKLVKRVEHLEKELYKLYTLIENNKIDKHVYSVKETAQILNITVQGVYAMIDRKELETVKLGHMKVLGTSLRNKMGVN